MSQQIDISVVIPVRNGMPYLPETLESILSQNIESIEVIVRDNFSTDGTSEWLESLSDPRVRVVKSLTSDSAVENWTKVCSEAVGKYIKVVCADDALSLGGLARQLDIAKANPNVALVASKRRVISHNGNVVFSKIGLRNLTGMYSGNLAMRKTLLSGTNQFGEPAAVLFRSDALKASLPFNSKYAYMTDLDMYRKVLELGDFMGLNSVDADFRIAPNSWSKELEKNQYKEFVYWLNSEFSDSSSRLSRFDRKRIQTNARIMTILRKIVTTFS